MCIKLIVLQNTYIAYLVAADFCAVLILRALFGGEDAAGQS